MDKKISVAVIGCGDCARNFVKLFKVHPFVSKVFVCDLVKSKAENYSKMFQADIIERIIRSSAAV